MEVFQCPFLNFDAESAATSSSSGFYAEAQGIYKQEETEIGCTIAPKYWRKGYAVEGLKAVIPFLFNTLRKKRIIARISIDNTGSRKLFECLGFQLISQNDGEAIYQLIKTD